MTVKNSPINKKLPNFQQSKFKQPNFPSCKRNNWLEFDKVYYCEKL